MSEEAKKPQSNVKLDEEALKRRKAIAVQWRAIAEQYPEAIKDLNEYVDGLREGFRRWGEEQAIFGTPIDDHRIAGLLQASRGCDIVRTYITGLIDQDVAQPIKNSK